LRRTLSIAIISLATTVSTFAQSFVEGNIDGGIATIDDHASRPVIHSAASYRASEHRVNPKPFRDPHSVTGQQPPYKFGSNLEWSVVPAPEPSTLALIGLGLGGLLAFRRRK
jgi:hypothetical protein